MIHLILNLFETIFPKYKPYRIGNVYGIKKRCFGVFYKRMTHDKIVDNKHWLRRYVRSYEILTFDREEDMASEIDRLYFGYAPIKFRVYKDGQLAEIGFADGTNYLKED